MYLAMRVLVLALNDVLDTGLAAILDTLGAANKLAENSFSITIGSLTEQVVTANGLIVPASPILKAPRPDIVVVPAINAPDRWPAALDRPEVADAGTLLRELRAGGSTIASACTGTFVLAEAGLLDGLSATTSWWLGPLFRSRYPTVNLHDDRMLVSSSGITTAGAVLAHFDLALWIVRQVGTDLAAMTARYLLIDARSSQTEYVIPDHLVHSDGVVAAFERWTKDTLAEGFSLAAAAAAAGVSPRTLARRTRAILGKTPLECFQDARIRHAVHLLQTTGESVDRIAEMVGYVDAQPLRLLLRKRLGRSALQIRRLA